MNFNYKIISNRYSVLLGTLFSCGVALATSSEYHSDQSTHSLITGMLAEGVRYKTIESVRTTHSPQVSVSLETLETKILPALKQMAEVRAQEIASRALKRSLSNDRWSGRDKIRFGLSRLVTEVLVDKDVRLGPIPSQETLVARAHLIEEIISRSRVGLRLTILAMPFRDRNPAKSDGQLPDLGEVSALLRLWTIGRAINIAKGSIFKENTRVVLIQDAKRYPPYFNAPPLDVENYRRGLQDLSQVLHLEDSLEITSHDRLESGRDPVEVAAFHSHRDSIYQEKLASNLEIFYPLRNTLFNSEITLNREEFQKLAESLDPDGKITPLIEAILHSRWHPEILELNNEDRMKFLANIFVSNSEFLQERKRLVLWSSIVGACEYAAAYEANSGTKNHEKLDDVEFLFPQSLRISIHRKPESSGHYTIAIGPSLHRTPWHGTAALHQSSNGRSISLTTRLSLELKHEHYVPIFADTGSPSTALVLSKLNWNNQPFFWIESTLFNQLKEECEGTENGNKIVEEIFRHKLKHF